MVSLVFSGFINTFIPIAHKYIECQAQIWVAKLAWALASYKLAKEVYQFELFISVWQLTIWSKSLNQRGLGVLNSILN